VTGVALERFTKKTNIDLKEGGERFQKVLESTGVTSELVRQGIQPGDTVHIANRELVWGEMEELDTRPKRRTAAERKLARKR
jgi:Obg family GTPase CgtA-like protein